jgi:hypothetical protein
VPDIYGLTPQEVMVLRSALAKLDKIAPQAPKSVGIGAGFVSRPDDMPSPDVYITRTPTNGIPGLTELTGTGPDEPGHADCQIWKIEQNYSAQRFTLVKIPGLTKKVFNLSIPDIPGDAWVPVIKTKGGAWIAIGGDAEDAIVTTGTGTGTDYDDKGWIGGGVCTDLLRLSYDDCVIATGPDGQEVTMRPNGSGTWTAEETIGYPGGSGILVLTFNSSTGLFDLVLSGLRLANCGNGCWSGATVTGHVTNVDDDVSCNGVVFTVCLSCSCCPDPLWDGEGWYCVKTGTGTEAGTSDASCEPLYLYDEDKCVVEICSGKYESFTAASAACGGVHIGCCNDSEFPGTLYVKITSMSSCTQYTNDTFELAYQGLDEMNRHYYQGQYNPGEIGCSCIGMKMTCLGEGTSAADWLVETPDGCDFNWTYASNPTCPPNLLMTFIGVSTAGCCSALDDVIASVRDTPW